MFTPKLRCVDLTQLNEHLAVRCIKLGRERKHPDLPDHTVFDVWE